MTIDEVVTLASLIEMEAKYPADYKKISSVFHNRLNLDPPMMLQCDATIQYARIYQGLGRTTAVLNKDLEINSPTTPTGILDSRRDPYALQGWML